MATCPFSDPLFVMDPKEPCPVCGMLGTPEADDSVCVGQPEDFDEDAIERLLTNGERAMKLRAEQVEWVVNDIAELGVKIGDQFFFLYKGASLVYGTDAESQKAGACLNFDADPPTKHMWRHVFKREFGECAHPINRDDPRMIGTVSPDDSDDWQLLPVARS